MSLLSRLRARLPPGSPPAEAASRPGTPAELRAEIDRLGGEVARLEDLVAEAKGRGDFALEVARDMSLPAKMLAFMAWLELVPPATGPTVSVILATRDRPQLLARAIPSVLGQRYESWQLVVVDDGSDPGTRNVVAEAEDERIVLVDGPQRGLSAARNAGLDRADGEIVCYLDDDNVMHPCWLQAVAHVFSRREDVDVAYGIAVAEHRIPGELGEHGWWPSFWQLPWSRENVLRENVTDAGSLAHRRDLEGVHFDEEIAAVEDWELLLRLTTDREALAIPALSHAYSMEGEDRMSREPGFHEAIETVRRRYEDA